MERLEKRGTPVGYLGRAAVRRKQYDMTPERRKSRLLLGNSSVNTRCFVCGPCRVRYSICSESKVGN
jgi:hypothetical protein